MVPLRHGWSRALKQGTFPTCGGWGIVMTKGIEIRDLTLGTGDEVTKDSIVVANVRTFLRRGDEVSPSPMFGTRRVLDLGRRHCIAGLRYGISGMRVGGLREIVISPHLAYGKEGIPGTIPANALLRCEVELLETREHSAVLPQDWLPGKVLMLRRCEDVDHQQPGWVFEVHESGNASVSFSQKVADQQQIQRRWYQLSIPIEAKNSTELIQQVMELPEQAPEVCVEWNSGFIDQQKGGTVVRDSRDGARCMVAQIMDSGKTVLLMGVHEESPTLHDSGFYKNIERFVMPHVSGP